MPDPKLGAGFFTPHDEAAAIVAGKPVVTRQVFDKLVPELRARAMVVTGVEGANTVQRIKDEIADYTRGQPEAGEARTWDDAKAAIAKTLEDEAFSPQAAERRATLLIRTHGFQAYQAANYRVAMEDDDTTHLQYLATEDSRVRDSHLALNGLIMNKNDPFWDKHYPPWEWGCRCRVRPINPDMLDRQRSKDATRPPEDRLVIEGPALDRLRAGQIVRGELKDRDGRTVGMGAHDVTPPSQKLGADKAFQWHPRDLRIPAEQLRQRYDPATWQQFAAWAEKTDIAGGISVLEWIGGRALPAPQSPGLVKAAALPGIASDSYREYVMRFGDLFAGQSIPRQLAADPRFVKLIQDALAAGKPLTLDDIRRALA